MSVMSLVMVASHTCSLRGKVSKPGHVRVAVLLVVSPPVCPVIRATCDLQRTCFLHCLRQHGSLSPGSCRMLWDGSGSVEMSLLLGILSPSRGLSRCRSSESHLVVLAFPSLHTELRSSSSELTRAPYLPPTPPHRHPLPVGMAEVSVGEWNPAGLTGRLYALRPTVR